MSTPVPGKSLRRWTPPEEQSMEENFTCKDCGSRDLEFIRDYTIEQTFEQWLPCECGDTADGIAATHRNTVTVQYYDRGILIEDHRVEWHDQWEEVEREHDRDGDETEVFCQACYEEYSCDEHAWRHEQPEEQEEPELLDEEYTVRCEGCRREIEFGWSHPDRGGRIWPAECTDFNPWKNWPEPRYREAWAEKGWLRPSVAA